MLGGLYAYACERACILVHIRRGLPLISVGGVFGVLSSRTIWFMHKFPVCSFVVVMKLGIVVKVRFLYVSYKKCMKSMVLWWKVNSHQHDVGSM